MPSKTTNNKTPFQLLNKQKSDYLHLKAFSCACFPLLPSSHRHKLQPRTLQCVFLVYPIDAKGYKCLNPVTGKLILSRHVIFDENHFPYHHHTPTSTKNQPTPSNPTAPLLLTPTSATNPPLPTSNISSPTNSHSTSPQPTSHNPLASIPSSSEELSNPQTATLSSNTQPDSHSSPPSPPQPLLPTHPMLTHAKTGSPKSKSIFTLHHTPTSTAAPTSFSQASKSPAWRTALSQEFNAFQSKEIHVQHLTSQDQIADIFIKALPTPRFKYLRHKLTLQSSLVNLRGDNNHKLSTKPPPTEDVPTICTKSKSQPHAALHLST